MVNAQRRNNDIRSNIDIKSATITVPVTIPLPDIPLKTWSELLDQSLAKVASKGKNDEEDRKKNSKIKNHLKTKIKGDKKDPKHVLKT